ncbi:MAG: gliding motility-associated C-terminal domain-containing protein [Bacteroidota bacterium]
MTNRLLHLFRALPLYAGVCLLMITATQLNAQQGFFTFTPPANTMLSAGSSCAASLASGGLGTPTVLPSFGATITASHFDPVASGYQYTDLFTAPYNNLIVSWFVSDNMGHTANFTFTVSIKDVTPPVLNTTSVPSPASYSSIVQVPKFLRLPVNDNCTDSASLIYVLNETPTPDTCDAGTFTRTWKVTDAAGNTAIYTQTINVYRDSLPPTVSVFPQNGSASCKQLSTAYPAWLAAQMANFTASDPSGIRSLTNNAPVPFPPGCKMPLTVTFRATDNCGIAFPTTAVFSTADNEPPIILSDPLDTVAYCNTAGAHLTALGNWINKHGYLTAIDSCTEQYLLKYEMRIGGVIRDSSQVVAALLASYANGCSTKMVGTKTYNKVRGKIQVEWYVKDACNKSVFAGPSEFGVIDTVAPIITGVDFTEECGGNDATALTTWINAHGNATVSDQCSGTVWTNFSWTTSTGQTGNGLFNTGPYPAPQAHNCTWWVDVTFRVTDDCGNVGSKKLRFRIADITKPVISGFPNPVTLPCTNPNPTLSPAFVSDNCDTSMVITYTALNKDSLCNGSYTRIITWSATDDCGNTGTATQTILVRDTQGPIFTLIPAPQTFRCDTFALPPAPTMGVEIKATDDCSPVMSITTQTTFNQNPNPAVCGHYTYTITRTFTATDQCNNTRTATQTISVVDNQGPVITGYLDTTAVCEIVPNMPAPTAIDPCSGPTGPPVMYKEDIVAGPCADTYTRVRFWRATDVCGNTSTFSQNIHIIDTVPPMLLGIPANLTVECNAVPLPPNSNTFVRSDNCDNSVSISFLESEIRDPNLNGCAHWANYLIRRVWTAVDNCGNTRSYTQNISVQDNTGPVLVPPTPTSLPADAGVCGAQLVIPGPISLYDDCTALRSNITLRDTVVLVASGGPPATTPVDTVHFQWSAPNLPPLAPVIGNASFTVFIDHADINDTSEYFNIYGEGGKYLGNTDIVANAGSCPSAMKTFTISANLLNSWMADGDLVITLAPNGKTTNAINPGCPNNRVRCALTYQVGNQQVPVTLNYSVDNGPTQSYPPVGNTFLEVGLHTIKYTATDCAGNTSTATSTIEIKDLQPPILAAPAPITAFVDLNCNAVVNLPFPNITENCDLTGLLNRASATLPLQFEYVTDAGIIPKAILLPVTGLIPNAVLNGKLTIRFRGDYGDNGEFFYISDVNNLPISTTQPPGPKAQECTTTYQDWMFTIPPATLNSWAAGTGTTVFKAIPNSDNFNFPDLINNCNPLLADQTDGISRIQAVLEYSYAEVTYEIRKNNVLVVPPGPLIGNQTPVTLTPGVYQVKYIVDDIHGLEGSTTFNITVRDTIKPKAKCLPTTISVSPSGLDQDKYILQPSVINNNSTDNCTGPLTYQLSQTVFTCNMATPPNNIYPVTLTVTDASGNSSTCTTTVRVEIAPLKPYYLPICEGGTLKLFADSLLTDPNNIYSFSWKNPAGAMFSTQRNPVIPNAQLSYEGIYTVTLIGSSGCMSVGTVDVRLVKLPVEPVLTTNAPLCQGDSLYLSTGTYSGQNVGYQWYYVAPSGAETLLASTLTPFFVIKNPAVGTYNYYIKVVADGCTSVKSQIQTVVVRARPVCAPDAANISVCEGQYFVLGTSCQGTPSMPMTYNWTGPNNFHSTAQYPPTVLSATMSDAGIYTLVVTQNGCSSSLTKTTVTVNATPPTPMILGQNTVCAFSNLTLVSNVTGIGYIWEKTSPPQTVNTSVNALVLTNLTVADSGIWRLRVAQQFCVSDWSAPFHIDVQPYPDVAAPSNINICQNDTLKLSATANVPGLAWCWTGPNNYTVYDNPKPLRFPGVPGQYKVVGKTTAGCSDSAFVQVVNPPLPVISSLTNNAPLCPNDTTDVILQAVVTTPNTPVTYAWYFQNNLFSTVPMPVLTDIKASNNGNYLLIVKDSFGCASLPATTTINVNNPLPPPILVGTADTVCAGTLVTFSVQNVGSYPGTVKFLWTIPGTGTPPVETSVPSYTINSAQIQSSGNYRVQVMSGPCLSPLSGSKQLVVNPIPQTPLPQSNSPVCEGDVLSLWISNLNANPSAQYFWSGPGITTGGSNPMYSPATEAYEGNWTVKVTVKNCTSFSQEPIHVVIMPKPVKPFIKPPSPLRYCKNDPSGAIKFKISSLTPGALYTWIHVEANDTIGGPTLADSIMIGNLSQFSPGAHSFKVIAHLNGCNSVFSESVTILIDSIPGNLANAGPDRVICANQTLSLQATQPSQGITGLWTQLSGQSTTIVNPDDPLSAISDFSPPNEYQYVWTLSNGGCRNFDSDTVKIKIVAPEPAMTIDSVIFGCADKSRQIRALQGQYSIGSWSQPSNQTIPQINIQISNPDSVTTTVSNLRPGQTYYFFWTLKDIGCGPSEATVTIRNYSSKPFIEQPDGNPCLKDSCITLQASPLQVFETGQWSSHDLTLTFMPEDKPNTEVCNLKPGRNEIYWSINDDFCGFNSRDTVIVNYELFPTANPDVIQVDYGALKEFNVLQNDFLPSIYTVSVKELPLHGSLDTISKGIFRYQPKAGFSATDQMVYEVCNVFCESACSATLVSFNVGDPGACILPSIITPNQDNVNETFIIPESCFLGVEGVINAEVTIFNQWGHQVFHADPYDNNKGWDGTLNGEPLPPGTYFYMVQIKDGSKPKTGFVIIQR